MTAPHIGSLFTGTGALDMAVQNVFGGDIAWHCQYDPDDKHQFAAHLLAHRWHGVPNLGDITTVDFTHVEPIDILTGGFPCQDVSLAGRRAGLRAGTRSGLWSHFARAIAELRPQLVVIENTRGLLSAPADSDMEPCAWCLGDTEGEPPLRALGAVLADLAELGLDAEWIGLPASSIGAPHERWREFLLAWPSDTQGPGLEVGREGRSARLGQVAADADHVGGHRAGACGARRHEPADHDQPAADTDGWRREGHPQRDSRKEAGQPERAPGLDAVGRGVRREGVGHDVASDSSRLGRGEGGAEPARLSGRSDSPLGSAPDWGQFEPAIRHWEHVLGRPAPRPVDDRGRLAPDLPEWMMGLPAGHITAVPPVPGMTAAQLRNAQLKAAGNGVVPQQAEAALRLLLARATAHQQAA